MTATTFATAQITSVPARRRPNFGPTPLVMLRLARQRRDLARLDDHQLSDIGLTRAEAQAETRRRFWDVPSFWRQ